MNSNTPAADEVTAHNANADDLANAAFRWLLVLGFPPAVAAASVMPQIFQRDEVAAERHAA